MADAASGGGPLKQAGLVGPALDRLDQQVRIAFQKALDSIIAAPESARGSLAAQVASPEDLRRLAEDPPSDLVAVLGPVLCPMLNWVRMFDLARTRKGKRGWEPSENFERAQRALLNGWYDDAFEAFEKAVDQDNPEDFVSLFGLGNLLLYWQGDPEAALARLEKAARYAVPMDAQPWMKRFAAESFIACAELHSTLHGDQELALKQLDNAEQLTEPRPEIDLARARIAARIGRIDQVAPAIQRAVSAEWLYAIQIAVDPAFPPEVLDRVITALNAQRSRIRAEAAETGATAQARIQAALAEDDSDIGPSVLASDKSKLADLAERIADATSASEGSLLGDLALAEKLRDLSDQADAAIQALRANRESVRAQRERASVGEKMAALQARRDEVDRQLNLMGDELREAEQRLDQEEAKALERAQQEAIKRASARLAWYIVPVLLLVLAYHFTEVRFSPTFSIGARESAPATPASGPAAPQAPTAADEDMTGALPLLFDDQGVVTAQLVSPDEVRATQQATQGEASGEPYVSYHTYLDGWVNFLFVVYVLLMIGLVLKSEWEALEIRRKAIQARTSEEKQKRIEDVTRRQAPLEQEQRTLSRQINELREKL